MLSNLCCVLSEAHELHRRLKVSHSLDEHLMMVTNMVKVWTTLWKLQTFSILPYIKLSTAVQNLYFTDSREDPWPDSPLIDVWRVCVFANEITQITCARPHFWLDPLLNELFQKLRRPISFCATCHECVLISGVASQDELAERRMCSDPLQRVQSESGCLLYKPVPWGDTELKSKKGKEKVTDLLMWSWCLCEQSKYSVYHYSHCSKEHKELP